MVFFIHVDSYLTPNNLSKVLRKVNNLTDVIYYLNMPTSSQVSSDKYLKQYPVIHPSPSWQDVANALYRTKLNDNILDVVRRDYLQGKYRVLLMVILRTMSKPIQFVYLFSFEAEHERVKLVILSPLFKFSPTYNSSQYICMHNWGGGEGVKWVPHTSYV